MNLKIWIVLLGMIFTTGIFTSCKSLTPAEATLAAGSEVRALISENVTDATKEKQMIALVDKLELDMKAFAEDRSAINKTLVEMNADYDASRMDMQKLYADLNEKTKTMALKIAQLHVDMHELSTPEEWKLISKNKNRIGGL